MTIFTGKKVIYIHKCLVFSIEKDLKCDIEWLNTQNDADGEAPDLAVDVLTFQLVVGNEQIDVTDGY